MTDAEILEALRGEYRAGKRNGRVREPEWKQLVALAQSEMVAGLTIHGTYAVYEPVDGDPMLVFGDHFSVRITP